jgi:type I restriction enzyme S subunit
MKPYASYRPSGVPWLGDVPNHWISAKLKFRLERNDGGAWGADPDGTDGTLVLRSTEQTVDGRWKIEDPAYRKLSPSEAEATLLVEGDLLVTKSSGSEAHIGKTSLVDAEIAGLRAGYSNFMQRLRVVEEVIPKYVWYLLNSDTTKTQVNVLASTTTGLANLNAGVLGRLVLAYPPPDEQQAIADYLDVENTRIDTLIREKDELIGLLREWRQSVIAEYTSGVTQPQGKKPTSNVHVPWIPSDWSMVRLGKYARIGNGSTPLKDNGSYWEGGTFPWLNSAVVNRDAVDEGSEYVTDVALRACHLPIVEPGAVLVALTGQGKTRGQVTVLRIQATINQHLAYLALDDTRFDSNFVFWSLTGMYAALRMVSDGQGGTKGALTCDDLARFEVPMPPVHVQQEIAKAISSETAKIDDLIAHTNDEITLLKELRAATIADAVLGRIDVRTATLQ